MSDEEKFSSPSTLNAILAGIIAGCLIILTDIIKEIFITCFVFSNCIVNLIGSFISLILLVIFFEIIRKIKNDKIGEREKNSAKIRSNRKRNQK